MCAAGCAAELVDFLDLGHSPLADSFPESLEAAEDMYPLEVAVCPSCWLVQLREVVSDDVLYGSDYGFRTGRSPAAARYFAALADELREEFEAQARRLTVEIACNDGTLLRHFRAAGCPVLGIEPVKPAAEEARARGITVLSEPFGSGLAYGMRGSAGLVVACNVAAHVADPADFLCGVRALLAPGGVAVIEFQDLAALVAGCQYDHVYHEHRFFYSLATFSRLAAKAGLKVFDWRRTPAQGGSMRVFLRRGRGVTGSDPWLEHMGVYESMQGRVAYAAHGLRQLVGEERDQGRVVAGWGASAKSATLLNYCCLGPLDVSWVEDLTPGKCGRFTPGSHIPIKYVSDVPVADTYLLTSWNYAGSVIRRETAFMERGGRFIIPGAVPVLL